MKLGRYADAVADAAEATYLEPTYVKGHYRLALAQQACGKVDRALRAAKAGLELHPTSVQLLKLVAELEDELKEQRELKASRETSSDAAAKPPASSTPAAPSDAGPPKKSRAQLEAELAGLSVEQKQHAARLAAEAPGGAPEQEAGPSHAAPPVELS